MKKPKAKQSPNATNNAIKKLKDDLVHFKALTGGAVQQLRDEIQTAVGIGMQNAQTIGGTMAVLDALIQHLGCESPVRVILDAARADLEAKRAEAAAALAAPSEPPPAVQ